MASEHSIEDSLRELIRDPAWSLPAWPEPMARVSRTARKQRIRTAATVVTAAAAVAVAAAVLPAQARTPVRPTPTGYALPPPGSAGFPISIYPAPEGQVQSLVGPCPNPAGLQRPPASIRSQALAVIDGLGRSFGSDLHLSDRTYWPQVQASWQAAAGNSATPTRSGQVRVLHYGRVHVLYSGPLGSASPAPLPRDLAAIVRTGCGHRIAADTWLVITSRAGQAGLGQEFLLLDRRGHVLVWNAE